MDYKYHTNCRCCGSDRLKMYLDLGMMPLANNLEPTFQKAINAPRYPLQVMFCENCSLSQLSIVVDPEIMFSNYVYRSSINAGYVAHCREMAKELKETYKLTEKSFMIDIAGNDGALLKEFRDEIGLSVLNIDPAVNMEAINMAQGIRILTDFWGVKCAGRLNGFGKADLITATNVFAHVDNVKDFLHGCNIALKLDGVLILEFPYLIDFIEKNEFDTVYFEHLSYFSIIPLVKLCQDTGLFVNDVKHFDIHGGSVRVTISKQPIAHDGLRDFVTRELTEGYDKYEKYDQYAATCKRAAESFSEGMARINYPYENIAAFAASAKGNTLLCYANNYFKIAYIVDETPEKIGKFAPGNGKPIVSMHDLQRTPPDYLIILSWNFANEIMAKCRNAGYKGKFVIPIPEWKVIAADVPVYDNMR